MIKDHVRSSRNVWSTDKQKMKVDDPQLSSVCLVIHCFLRVNLLAVVVQSLPGVRLGGVSFGEPLVQGQKKKKEKKKETWA